MANIGFDPQFSDSYSECGSSNSSFSYGLLTPTTTADFSAASSRRQSIVSESQSCNGNTFDKVPSFSCEGAATPLQTPPLFGLKVRSDRLPASLQGYETKTSPLGSQYQRRVENSPLPETSHFRNPFPSQAPYFCSTGPAVPERDILDEYEQSENPSDGSRVVYKPMMDWSASFSNPFTPGYDDTIPMRAFESLEFDPSARLDLGCAPSEFSQAMTFGPFGSINVGSTNLDLPQTIAPQETFVSSRTPFTPSTPPSEQLESAFETPVIKSEVKYGDDDESMADQSPDPYSSSADDHSPIRHSINVLKRKGLFNTVSRLPSRRISRSTRNSRKSFGIHNGIPYQEKYSSSNKPFRCEECDMSFDRPEHCSRHKKTQTHANRCVELGKPNTGKCGDNGPYMCLVRECQKIVTRSDNLKPHYQKTHFFDPKTESRKKNKYVSREEAKELGLERYDHRPPVKQEDTEVSKTSRSQKIKETHEWKGNRRSSKL
ncbi:MAG: hypothetical protein Q9222_002301 [Ikaeria aurantiellina]